MTDKKNVFDAPWHVSRDKDSFSYFFIKDDEGCTVAKALTRADAKRIALLPVLYDKFKEAAYEQCYNCCFAFRDDDGSMPGSDEMVKKGCPKNQKECFCNKWWTLLNAVRLGK